MRIQTLSARPAAIAPVLAVCFLVALPSGAALGAEPQSNYVAADQLPPIYTGLYRIQVGDVLNVNFFKTTQLNQTLKVGPDGDLYLPLVGRVRVAGRTVDDITADLTEGFSTEMVDPQITVSVAEFSGLFVHVAGEVNSPGLQPYSGQLTAVQAIMDAGGFADRGRKKSVLLIRRDKDGKPVGTVIDVKAILHDGQFAGDVALAPSDIVYVPMKNISKVSLTIQEYLTNNLPLSLYLGYDISGP
ncbi:MAG: polysaccharide export protein [Thermoanaerobaculales bacterium]|nr:polysaccharide export protein [Thermoanaerobaculales bacterium]